MSTTKGLLIVILFLSSAIAVKAGIFYGPELPSGYFTGIGLSMQGP